MRRLYPTLATSALAIAAGVALVFAPALLAMVVPLGLGAALLRVLVLAVTKDEPEPSRLGGWVALALAAHLLAGWLGQMFNFAPDTVYYDRVSQQLADHWRHGYPFQALPFGKEGFFYLLASLYRIFGHYTTAGIIVNCVFASATVTVVYDTTKRLFGTEAARFVGPVMMLPAFLLWTSMLLREATIILLMAVAVNTAVRLSHRFGAGQFVLMAASLTLLFTFRANVALLLLASLLPALALSRRELVTGLGTGITVMALVLVLVVGAGVGYSGYKLTSGASLEQVEFNRRELSQTAESGFSGGADVSTAKGAFAYLPVGLVNFMLGPFPWQMRNVRQLLALPDVILWLGLMPALWRGILDGIKLSRRKSLLLLMPAGLIAVMLSLVIGNFGTAIRERIQVVVVLVPFIALGLARRRAAAADAADRRGGIPATHAMSGARRPLTA